MVRSTCCIAVVAALVVVGPLAAQIPGDELPQISRVREEFLRSTYADVKQVLSEWQKYHNTANVEKMARMFTLDGFYSPVEGWFVQGRESVADTLAHRAPRVKGYHVSLLDFAASGSLAYYVGRLSYRLEQPYREVAGVFVMVLYQQGRTWRIRSYVERAG